MSAACPVFGVIIRFEPVPGANADAVVRALGHQVLQPRGLVASVLDARGNEIVIMGDGFQTSDADREAIVRWLSGQPLIASYEVTQLGDVGHAA